MSGAAYRDRRGDPVELGEQLGAGGEGSVFALPDRPRLCAKIYRPDKAASRAEKIHVMLARRPPWLLRAALGWPVEPLYAGADRTSFAGFLMPARRGMFELFRLLVPDERMQIAGWLTQRDLCLVAARIARLVAGIHGAGHCIGDLKPQNILVSPLTGRVALIDTDSFQIRDPKTKRTHRSVVLTPEYTAPELCGVNPTSVDRTPASDAFALAVLIHQILLGGAHPFEGELTPGCGAGSVERVPGRIRRGLCPIVPGVTAVRQAAGALSINGLHEDLGALFVRTFGPGHAAPSQRPTAAEWHRSLARAAAAMVRCPANAAHLHDRARAACPWCERRTRTGIDLFSADQRWQRAVARVADPAAAPEQDRIRWLRRHARGRLVEGQVTAAERAWLEKTGAALGFDRARVAGALQEAAAPGLGRRWRARFGELAGGVLALRRLPSLPTARLGALAARLPRRRLLLSAVSLAAASACASAVLTTSRPMADPLDPEAQGRPVCAVAAPMATIGNTRGRGAFLRAAPSMASDKLPLPEGTVVWLTGRSRAAEDLEWSEVLAPAHGRAGWVATRYLLAPR